MRSIPCHEVHCRSCESLYGEPFPENHRWMDEPVEDLGGSHQEKRHDIERTVERVGSLFGEEAAIAVRDHILLDKRWGETGGVDPSPDPGPAGGKGASLPEISPIPHPASGVSFKTGTVSEGISRGQ